MHLKTEELQSIDIEFGSGILPPPYSNTFKLRVQFGKDSLNTRFELRYTDREELTDEEIFEEGFGLEDDYNFEGEIPLVWEAPLKMLYSVSNWSGNSLGEEGGIKLLAKDQQGKIARHIPHNQEEWVYCSQQIIQAIYEVSKKEEPLTVRFYSHTTQESHLYALTVKFSERKIDAVIDGTLLEPDWDSTHELLSDIYLAEYDYSIAEENKPEKRGFYIDCGDGLWHELGRGVVNMDPSYNALHKIKSGFAKLATLV